MNVVRVCSVALVAFLVGCSSRPAPTPRPVPVTVPTASVSPSSRVTARSGVAEADAAAPVTSSSSPAAPASPRDLPPARPCAIAVSRAVADTSDDCIELDRVRPEGRALTVCFARTSQLSFRYDDKGRIVESPTAKYTYGAGREATRSTGGRATKLQLDAGGRLVQDGAERLRYDALGRLVRAESGGRFLAYLYAPDDTYTTNHNYPDRDEFCVADRVEVVRDARGRVARDRYDHCGINEIPRTLHYHYGPKDELETLEVDLQSDASIDATLRLRYECP